MKPISISLSPNTEKDDIDLALKLIFRPSEWKIGVNQRTHQRQSASTLLEEEFKKYLGIHPVKSTEGGAKQFNGVKYAIYFNSGRSALIAILDALGIKKGDEILLQAFTCNSAVNPILNLGAKPVFVDIDETLNLNPEDLKKKITEKSKAVMIQHTFGWPAKIDEISEICKEHNLYLIEDCAHSLGAEYKSKKSGLPAEALAKAGTFGDAAFFSFGRDKIISSVFGGMAVTNNDEIGERIKEFQEKLDFPSNFWIFQQLLHPILTNYLVLPAYGINSNLGRIILGLFHVFKILSKGVYRKEKEGEIPKYFPKKFSNALAILALNQFKKLERFNEHRREIANFYEDELKNTKFILPLAKSRENIIPTFMRYPILTNLDPEKILREARKRKIYLDDGWRKTPIVPPDTKIDKMKYSFGSCPKVEEIVPKIFNLPTHINISLKDAQKIIEFLKNLS